MIPSKSGRPSVIPGAASLCHAGTITAHSDKNGTLVRDATGQEACPGNWSAPAARSNSFAASARRV